MKIVIISFRLGQRDGVSIEAEKWRQMLADEGHQVTTMAGEGKADLVLPYLSMHHNRPLSTDEIAQLEQLIRPFDLAILENILSLPFNQPAAQALTQVLTERSIPAILHHHDLAWQRSKFRHIENWPPRAPRFLHVVINRISQEEMRKKGIASILIYNAFDEEPFGVNRAQAREALGIPPQERVLLQPSRAIARKRIDLAVALANHADARLWVTGEVEEGYDAVFNDLMERLDHQPRLGEADIALAYAACDGVCFGSDLEGFGNPTIESALAKRPLFIGSYPVAVELRELGFKWYDAARPTAFAEWLCRPDRQALEQNHALATRYFSLNRLRQDLRGLIGQAGRA